MHALVRHLETSALLQSKPAAALEESFEAAHQAPNPPPPPPHPHPHPHPHPPPPLALVLTLTPALSSLEPKPDVKPDPEPDTEPCYYDLLL